MGEVIDGVWHDTPAGSSRDGSGRFQRKATSFRDWVTRDGSSGFTAEAGRYHLYAAHACPWAHRTVVFRRLKRLEDVITLSYVKPLMLENGWELYEDQPQPVDRARYMHHVYTSARPDYTGRASVPVLWDRQRGTIVSNESAEIIRMLNDAFADFTDDRADYYPADLRGEIGHINERVYETVNNGVYRAGFAASQEAYEEAARALFESLDWLEARLGRQRYLAGDRLTEADWRLFTTLVRFDWVYHTHFKCNRRKIAEYPNLGNFLRELYQIDGVAGTVDMPRIMQHYYGSHATVNPTGIVALGPDVGWLDQPHDRARLPAARAA